MIDNGQVFVNEKNIVKTLSKRTGMDEDLIHTLVYHLERTILHHVMMGHIVRINQFFTIYRVNKVVEIELTDKAKRLVKRK
jgi:hypothetical protein